MLKSYKRNANTTTPVTANVQQREESVKTSILLPTAKPITVMTNLVEIDTPRPVDLKNNVGSDYWRIKGYVRV